MMTALLSLFLAIPALADSVSISKFAGVNNAVDPVAIEQSQMQDGMNVEANRTRTGIKKRDGYVSALNVTSGGTGITSGFMFKNASGDECAIFADAAGNVKKSANLTASVAVTTITATGRLWCQENNGTAYCFTSNSEIPFTYDCVTFAYKYTDSYPYGRANVFTLDRQVVISSGSSFPNRAYFSKSGDFDEFDTGGDEHDAFFEDIGSAGDKLIGVYWLNGRVIFAKEYSILGAIVDTQFDFSGYGICSRVGIPNAEAMVISGDAGYFKGTDNEFYRIDGTPSGCEKISLSISSTTAQLLNGKSRYNIQTENADWAAGTASLVSYSQVVGSVEPSTVTLLEDTSAEFLAGTYDQVSISTWAVYISTLAANITNNEFEADTVNRSPEYWSLNATATVNYGFTNNTTAYVSNTSPISGAKSVYVYLETKYTGVSGGENLNYTIIGVDGSTYITRTALPANDPAVTTTTINTNSYFGNFARFKLDANIGESTFEMWSSSFGVGTTASFEHSQDRPCLDVGSQRYCTIKVDNFKAEGYYSSGTFTSKVFDTGIVSPIGGVFSSTFTASSTSGQQTYVLFDLRDSNDNSTWTDWVATSDTLKIGLVRRYWQYRVRMHSPNRAITPYLTTVGMTGASTGTYTSQCINVGSGISAWGVTETAGTNNCGSIAYEASTGTACGSMQSFVAFSTGAVPSVNTAAALKYRMTFSLNSASCTARLDSITTNWNEGSAPPPTVGVVWRDSAYWGVATTGSQNNRTLKLDLISGDWFIFDMPIRSAWTWNNTMYFGGTTAANAYKFSDQKDSNAPTSDDGSAINSYWHSKAFGGMDPFKELTLDKISLVAKKQGGGTVTSNWRMNGGDTSSGSFTVALSTGPNVVRHNYVMPNGSRGTFYDLKISNNNTYPWEILGVKFDYTPKDWRVMP